MREEAPHNLDELAAAVADGRVLDWDNLESSARDEDERSSIRRLRAIAAIGHAHTELTLSDSVSESLSVRSLLQGEDDPSTPSTWGTLQILNRVGRGRFGDVYRAWDPSLDREVALKLLRRRDDSTGSDRAVIEEGRLMARVRHPNVITIHGAQRIDGRTGLWMEFIEGRTLEADLNERGFFQADEVARVGIELCRALAAVHEAGLVHRDVKAQNVMRDRSGRILLGDFGTGRELPEAIGPNELVGTPAYLAPEVLRGEPATRQSDVYSLGVLLFHLATGTFPVRGRSIREIRAAHDRRDRASIATARTDLSKALVSAIERALHPDPSSRFDSALAMQTALETAGAAAESGFARARYVRVVGLAAVVMVAIAAAFAAWQGEEPRPDAEIARDQSASASMVMPEPAKAAAASAPLLPASQPSSLREDVPAVAPTARPTPSDSNDGAVPPELAPGGGMWTMAAIDDYLRAGDTAVARRYAAAVPVPANPNDLQLWRLSFEAQASWQELKAQDSLEAVDAYASSAGASPAPVWMYMALGRLKQAEQFAAALPPADEGKTIPGPASREWTSMLVLRYSADRARFREVLASRDGIGLNYEWLIHAGLLGQAENVMRTMRTQGGGKSTLPVVEAEIMRMRGEPARAIEMLRDVVPTPAPTTKAFASMFFSSNALLARVRALAWEALGEPARGIEALQEFDVDRHVLNMGTAVPPWFEHRALLARLYRAAGRESEARPIEEELRKLLAVADDDHPIVIQLRALADARQAAKPSTP